jgi:hypothetical protein
MSARRTPNTPSTNPRPVRIPSPEEVRLRRLRDQLTQLLAEGREVDQPIHHLLNTITDYYTVDQFGNQRFSHRTETGYQLQRVTHEKKRVALTPEERRKVLECRRQIDAVLQPIKDGGNETFRYVQTIFSSRSQTSIDNLGDAIQHWRSKAGGTIQGTRNLYQEMIHHFSFQERFGPSGTITKLIERKAIAAFRGRSGNFVTISNEPNSRAGMSCPTLGSYSAKITYHHFITRGQNKVRVHVSGSDRWDFEENPEASFLYNLFHEIIPRIFARDGTPFNITYDFDIDVQINVP